MVEELNLFDRNVLIGMLVIDWFVIVVESVVLIVFIVLVLLV